MEINSIPQQGIVIGGGQDLRARVENQKEDQQLNQVEYAKQAFNFKLANQPDIFAKIDFLRNADNFELGSSNVNRLSGTNNNAQNVAMPEGVTKAIKDFASQRAPEVIDETINSLFNPYHGQEIKDKFTDATSYIREQLETTLLEGDKNGSYGLTYANMQSLKELAFHLGSAISLQNEFSAGTFGNTQAGYQSDLVVHLARATNRQDAIQKNNQDESFKSILQTSSNKVFDQVYTKASEQLGKDIRSSGGFNKLYKDIVNTDQPSEGWLVRKKSINLFV